MNYKLLLSCLVGISTCFMPDVLARNAIVGGRLAEPSINFQYQVSVMIPGQVSQCGGGIIGDDFVITAARCVIAPNGKLHGKRILVIAKTSEFGVGLVRKVKVINLPLEFHPGLYNSPGDIAVLKLEESLNIKEHNLRQLLITRNILNTHNYPITIAGFGWNIFIHNNLSRYNDHYLRYEEAHILDEAQCLNEHPAMRMSNTLASFCARVKQTTERSGVCKGDEGGPLVFNNKIILGVLSKIASNCSERASSGLYTSASHYQYFIKSALEDRWLVNQRIINV